MRKLLVLGAGVHGQVVKEAAVLTGHYEIIDFLDDINDVAIGSIDDLQMHANRYTDFFVAIGNCEVRRKMIRKIKEMGLPLINIIHPMAYVSSSAIIGEGTFIGPGVVVHTNAKIGMGCILSAGAVIEHNFEMMEYCHIDTGAICRGNRKMPELYKLEAGQVFK